MKKITIILLLVTIFILCFSTSVMAHKRPEHDKDLEAVLFGNENYAKTHPIYKSKIQAIENAAYLTIDQFNGFGQDALDELNELQIPDIPDSIDAIDFPNFINSNNHRFYTHRGWQWTYTNKEEEIGHWSTRKAIMVNTVDTILFESEKPPLSWFPLLSQLIYGDNEYEKQRDAFCAYVYYIHLLGDHIEANEYIPPTLLAPLVRPNNTTNAGIIPELISYSEDLFKSQTKENVYLDYKNKLLELQNQATPLVNSEGGLNTEEEFEEYKKCAEDLLDLLKQYVPALLKDEDFFHDVFYK